jgi:hypothetical protein
MRVIAAGGEARDGAHLYVLAGADGSSVKGATDAALTALARFRTLSPELRAIVLVELRKAFSQRRTRHDWPFEGWFQLDPELTDLVRPPVGPRDSVPHVSYRASIARDGQRDVMVRLVARPGTAASLRLIADPEIDVVGRMQVELGRPWQRLVSARRGPRLVVEGLPELRIELVD